MELLIERSYVIDRTPKLGYRSWALVRLPRYVTL
jgi:hypothetical protein